MIDLSPKLRLGILGGGQLGSMLLDVTKKWGAHTLVLDPSENAPCRNKSDEFYVGDLMDFDTVCEFGRKANLVTVEIEHVSVDALEKLEEEGITVYPPPSVLAIVQNKIRQKLFYIDNDIPTAIFSRFAYAHEIERAIKNEALSFPFVWKSARHGYDGQGVRMVRTYSDLETIPDGECVLEEYIPFDKELAIIVARNTEGKVICYPAVEMEFHPEANQVEYVLCPARISEEIAKKAEYIALKTAMAFEHVGLLAVEMFVTQEGEILVNEVAPRPHNSGHYSIEGSYTSQFEQHLRAIFGMPFGSTDSKTAAVMVNLVGEEGYRGPAVYKNLEEIEALSGVHVHIYGKAETRPFRKMGHITIVHDDIEEARRIAERVKRTVKITSKT